MFEAPSPECASIALILEIVDVRLKAIQVVLSFTAGAYQTSLISYFTHRDLFPALMKVLQTFFFFLVGNAAEAHCFMITLLKSWPNLDCLCLH